MKIEKELKYLENSSAELTVTVKKSEAKEKYDALVQKYVKEAQLPGFRKGKVPVSILEKKYGESLRLETASDIIDEALKEYFQEADKFSRPLGYKQAELVGDIDFNPEKDFTFVVKYDVFPKVELKKVDGFTIEVPEVNEEEAALEDALKDLQMRNSFVVDRKDADKAENDNIATIDYCELDDNDNEVEGSKRQDFVFTIGSGMNLYKFDDEIVGMKKGEEKVITKTFADDFEDKDLAGKSKKIKVKLTALKFRELPEIDDDLAQDVSEKYKTLDDLKADLKKNIDKSVEQKLDSIKKDAYFEKALVENDVVLPQSMMDAEMDSRWANFARQIGMSVEQLENFIKKTPDAISKESFLAGQKEESEKVLKERVFIETLLDDRKIEVTDDELENEYKVLAEESGMEVEDFKTKFANPQYVEYFKDIVKERKLFEQIFENCTIKKGKKISVKELLESRN